MLVGLLSGTALGLSGLIMQTILRNPLASPELTGVTMGGALSVVATIVFLPGIGAIWHPFIAMLGGGAAGGVVLGVALSRRTGPLGLILGGVAVSSFCGAGVMLILKAYSPFSQPAYVWLVGALAGRGFTHFYILLPGTLIGMAMLLAARNPMRLLALGDEAALAAGVNVGTWRGILLTSALIMTASVVAIAGPIAFVGLLAPHLARLTLKSSQGLILSSALWGGVLMVSCDWLARVAVAPKEVPVGLFLAAIGAPIFVWLIRNSRNMGAPDQGVMR